MTKTCLVPSMNSRGDLAVSYQQVTVAVQIPVVKIFIEAVGYVHGEKFTWRGPDDTYHTICYCQHTKVTHLPMLSRRRSLADMLRRGWVEGELPITEPDNLIPESKMTCTEYLKSIGSGD